MKILNIMFESILDPQGGLGVFVRDTMAELAKSHQVSILGYDPLTIDHCDKMFNGCRVVNCRNTNIQQKPRGPFHLLALNDMMTENLLYNFKGDAFDIIHLHDSLLWPIAKYASIMFRAPIVTHCHLSHALVHRDYPFTDQKKWEVTQEAHAYMMSRACFTCSKSYAYSLQDYFMFDTGFTLATNGVNFDELRHYSYDKDFNHSLGDGKPVVGFIGRMVPSKGIELIIEAIKAIPEKHFVIISNIAPTVEKYMPLVKDIQRLQESSKNITWFKDIPTASAEKWKLMASCDLALVPSLHEPWGIVTSEWASLNVPKIVTRVGGLVEHNTDTDSIMIDPDAQQLCDAIQRFEIDPDKVSAAYNMAEGETWAKTADILECKYKEVMSC